MSRRSYGQYCALAKTLDLVGERWTLLIIRDLMLGPRRYSDLLDGLPGIGTSLLAARLKHLEDEGVVSRRELPPPAASTVYELTRSGGELAEALLPIAVWGVRHRLGAVGRDEYFRVAWPLMAIRELAEGAVPPDLAATYEFRVEGSTAQLRAEGGRLEVRDGPGFGEPDLVVEMGAETFVELGTGRLEPGDALAGGRVQIEGDPELLPGLFTILEAARQAPVTT